MQMDYALIKSGTVQNVIVATPEFIASIASDWDHIEPVRDGAGIGWGWNGEAFIAPEPEHAPEMPAPAPQTCTPAQGLVALFALKQITDDDIKAAIGAIEDPVLRYTASIGFARANEWRRDSETMQQMAALLGLSESDLDDLYAYAVDVQV